VGIGEDQGTLELLFRVGEKEKAIELSKILGDRSIEVGNYYISKGQGYSDDSRRYIYMLGELQNILYRYGEGDLAKKLEDAYDTMLKNLRSQEFDIIPPTEDIK
jgi:hypothetical protein